MKEDFAAELAHLEDALQIEKEHVQERMNTLRAKHETELCALREELGKEKAHLEKALQEEKNKFTCLEAALDSDNSKNFVHSQTLAMNLGVFPHSFKCVIMVHVA